MIKTVDKFLDEYNLKQPDKTFFVGFSGGCDSLCLLDILNDMSKVYGFKIIALHLNHNWRGEESLRDEQNCKRYCETKNIQFISETLQNGQKTESFARDARYNFFLKYAKQFSNSCIFTAHTRTDNAETVIYRLTKGTGITGLQGIPQMRMLEDIPIYRPLLQLSRKNIEDYCISRGLVANTDSSNFDITYKRNFIRHKIMPLLKEINFNAEKSISTLSKIAISYTNIVNEYMDLIKKEIYEENKILTQKFKSLSKDIQEKLIYDLFLSHKLDYDSKKIDNILEFLKENFNAKSGSRYSIAESLWVFANSQYIYLINKTKADENTYETIITQEGEYELSGTNFIFSIQKYSDEDFKFPSEKEKIAYVNLQNVGLNLKIRTRREGDHITPFGMEGSMKLKKYLNAKHVFQHEKDELVLLCKDNEVLWVAGVGLSNKLKVVNRPTHVIKLLSKESVKI